MNLRIVLTATSLVVLLGTGCGPSADDDADVLARIGEDRITVAEFEREMARRSEGRPNFFQEADHRRELLDDLIRHRMLVQEARQSGIADEPAFRALVERMLIQRLREKRLDERLADATPDDDAVRAYYEANIEAFTRPTRRQVAMIRVDAPASLAPETRSERRGRIEAAREAAASLPESIPHFGDVAVNYSDDRSSRYQGGIVGWLVDEAARRYQWPDPVLEAAFALESPGEMTSVIDAGEAFYLVRLADLEPGRAQPVDEVADGIRHRLTRERARALEGDLFAEIEQRHDAVVNEDVLDRVEPPQTLAEAPSRRQDPPAMPVDPGDVE
jgi:parvulin-like peptidyl-prolyl isomerase